MNKVLGTKFKIVLGYRSSSEVFLAMERGEIAARSVGLTSVLAEYPDWIARRRSTSWSSWARKRDPMLPDVPLLTELAKTDEQRQILTLISSPTLLGQPYLAPPGVPADRVATLRAAFKSAIRDPGFLADTKSVVLRRPSAERRRGRALCASDGDGAARHRRQGARHHRLIRMSWPGLTGPPQ